MHETVNLLFSSSNILNELTGIFCFHFFFRQIFCDFGDSFVVTDTDGEQPVSVLVSAITRVSQPVIHTMTFIVSPDVMSCDNLFCE